MKRTPRTVPPTRQRGSGPTYFTLQQARRALVLVRRIVADIVEEYPRLLECQEMLELSQRHGSVECLQRIQADLAAAVERLQGYSDELSAVGVELCDHGSGRVEFPALRDGRHIRLCWQFGEQDITAWYDPNHAQAARRSVKELAGT